MSPVTNEIIERLKNFKIYDLGQPYYNGMPVHPEDPPFQMYIYRYHDFTRKIYKEIAPDFSDSIELIITSMHSGTHIDALCHMARQGKVFSGIKASEIVSHTGYTRLGSDEIPIYIGKAVLLDVPKIKGLEVLPPGYEITSDDLEEAVHCQGVQIKRGDTILIRTGYGKYFINDPSKYLNKYAGINRDSTKWIINKSPSIVGMDNLALSSTDTFDVHLMLLVDHGIYPLKNLYLEELSRDNQYEFILIVIPLKILGATGSLVRPIALAPLDD